MEKPELFQYPDQKCDELLRGLRSDDYIRVGVCLMSLVNKPAANVQLVEALQDLLNDKRFFRFEVGVEHSYCPVSLAAGLALVKAFAMLGKGGQLVVADALLVVTSKDEDTWSKFSAWAREKGYKRSSEDVLMKGLSQLYRQGKLQTRTVTLEAEGNLKWYKYRPL